MPNKFSLCRALVCLALVAAAPTVSRAAIIITFTESGSDVVAVGSGTADLTDLSLFLGNIGVGSFVRPSGGILAIGNSISDEYYLPSAHVAFGSGNTTLSTSKSGPSLGLSGLGSTYLVVPIGYVSGTQINATATWANQTFSSMGMTPGSYTTSWGAGAHADSLTINIVAATPEPALGLLSGLLLGAMAFLRRRKA